MAACGTSTLLLCEKAGSLADSPLYISTIADFLLGGVVKTSEINKTAFMTAHNVATAMPSAVEHCQGSGQIAGILVIVLDAEEIDRSLRDVYQI